MKPRKIRLTGKMHEVPREELKQVAGGDPPWTTPPPQGADDALLLATDKAGFTVPPAGPK